MNAAATVAAAFVALYVGHMVGDHLAQTDQQAAHKASKGWAGWAAMAGHVASYGLCQAVALAGLLTVGVPLPPVGVLAGLGLSVATHAIVDRRWPVQWLLRTTGSPNFAALNRDGLNGMYLADQALHIAAIFGAALIIGGTA